MTFFGNYLVNRKTKYLWNDFSSPLYNIDVRVSQESALFLILSTFYLSSIFHIFKKCLKNLNIPISVLSFVNNKLFISQSKLLFISNANLFYSYNIILFLLMRFGLVIEYDKMEIFYFSRLHGTFNPHLLDLTSFGRPTLLPKHIWKYLGFIFDRKLLFWAHIDFYANKTISTIKCMKMLGNLTRGLISLQKRQLYRCCILPIALYSFQL